MSELLEKAKYHEAELRSVGCIVLADTLAGLMAEKEQLQTISADLQDVLLRNGFVRCDVSACNCGSWHARYGLKERFEEINKVLRDAGVLNNDTGNLAIKAIAKLIGQRDAAESRLRELCEMGPVAYGYPNTAITGSGPTMMMLRHEVPADDQYAGAFWIPLIPSPSMSESGK